MRPSDAQARRVEGRPARAVRERDVVEDDLVAQRVDLDAVGARMIPAGLDAGSSSRRQACAFCRPWLSWLTGCRRTGRG